MIRNQDGRWLWSDENQGCFEKAQVSLPVVEPFVEAETQQIRFTSTNLPSLLGMTPVLSLIGNNHYLPTRMNGMSQTASIQDAERGSDINYFGMPSSDIIIGTQNEDEVFPKGKYWIFERENIPEYGVFTEVNVAVTCRNRDISVSVDVSYDSYQGVPEEWSETNRFTDIKEVQRYLNVQLPWSRFGLNNDLEFSHLLEFPTEIKRATTLLSTREGKPSCRFTLHRQGYQRIYFYGLFLGNDGNVSFYHDRTYSESNSVGYYTQHWAGFGVSKPYARHRAYNTNLTSNMLLHPVLYDELRAGASFYETKSFLTLFGVDDFSCKQTHLALGQHDDLDSTPRSTECHFIEDFRLICQQIDITNNLIESTRLSIVEDENGGIGFHRFVLLAQELTQYKTKTKVSVSGAYLTRLHIRGRNPPAYGQLGNSKHVLSPSSFRARAYSPKSETGVIETQNDEKWVDEVGKYVFLSIVPGNQCEFSGLYVHTSNKLEEPTLRHLRLMPANAREQLISKNQRIFSHIRGGAPSRIHPSRLHEILFSDSERNSHDDFIYNGLPLAIYHIDQEAWCLCLDKERNSPVIKAIRHRVGLFNTWVLELHEDDKRWHLPENQRMLEGNAVFSWLLSQLEVME